jgi:hypothetical protein
MSVIDWTEIHNGRDSDFETSKKQSVRRYTRVFQATTDSNTDDGLVVKQYANCPRHGDVHNSDPGAWCRKVNARNESFSKRVWLVTAAYSSEYEVTANPLDDPADIDWDAVTFTRPYTQDKDGDAILNSAGCAPDPPLEDDDALWVVNVRKNLAAIPAWILSFKNTVNSSSFVLDGVPIAARQARLSGIKISNQQERNDISYRVVSMSFRLKDDGDTWDKVWLDQGMMELNADDTKLQKITDANGAYVTSPVPLDGSGHKLALPTPSTAVYNTDKILKEANHAVLPIT